MAGRPFIPSLAHSARHADCAAQSHFTILAPDDQIPSSSQVIEAENIDEKRWPATHAAIG